jgi:hypothetical protein
MNKLLSSLKKLLTNTMRVVTMCQTVTNRYIYFYKENDTCTLYMYMSITVIYYRICLPILYFDHSFCNLYISQFLPSYKIAYDICRHQTACVVVYIFCKCSYLIQFHFHCRFIVSHAKYYIWGAWFPYFMLYGELCLYQ